MLLPSDPRDAALGEQALALLLCSGSNAAGWLEATYLTSNDDCSFACIPRAVTQADPPTIYADVLLPSDSRDAALGEEAPTLVLCPDSNAASWQKAA